MSILQEFQVATCGSCGMTYVDSVPKQEDIDLYYRNYSKYESLNDNNDDKRAQTRICGYDFARNVAAKTQSHCVARNADFVLNRRCGSVSDNSSAGVSFCSAPDNAYRRNRKNVLRLWNGANYANRHRHNDFCETGYNCLYLFVPDTDLPNKKNTKIKNYGL